MIVGRKVESRTAVPPSVVARKIADPKAAHLTRAPLLVPKGAVQKRAGRKDEASEVAASEVVDLEVGEEEAHVAVDSAQVVSDNVEPEGAVRWLARQGSAAVRQGSVVVYRGLWLVSLVPVVVQIGSIRGLATSSGNWMKSFASCAS